MIQVFYCTNTREYTYIPSWWGKLVFDSSHLRIYTRKIEQQANLFTIVTMLAHLKGTAIKQVNINELQVLTIH